jgi:hypothetical protein
MKTITTDSIISEIEGMKEDIKKDKQGTPYEKAKMLNTLINTQIKVAMVTLAYRKSAARLPEHNVEPVALINATPDNPETRQ